MTASENIVPEVVEEDVVVESVEEVQQEVPEPAAEAVQESDQEMNFRKLREANEDLRKTSEKNRDMMLLLQEELLKRGPAVAAPAEPEKDEFAGLDNDDLLTYGQSQKLAAKIAAKAAKEAVDNDRRSRHKEEAPGRVRARYQDFDSIVTDDNVRQLQVSEPELAKALGEIADEEAQAIAAYKYIKMMIPQAAAQTHSKKRIEENASQPRSLSSTGGASPLSQAGAFEQGLTPELKKQLFSEMQECARQA